MYNMPCSCSTGAIPFCKKHRCPPTKKSQAAPGRVKSYQKQHAVRHEAALGNAASAAAAFRHHSPAETATADAQTCYDRLIEVLTLCQCHVANVETR